MLDIKAMAVEAGFDASKIDGTIGWCGWDVTPELQALVQLVARECLNAVNGEALEDPCDTADDIAYSNAVRDCGAAIKARFGLEG